MRIFILSFTAVMVVLVATFVGFRYNNGGPTIYKCQTLIEQNVDLPGYAGQEFCKVG